MTSYVQWKDQKCWAISVKKKPYSSDFCQFYLGAILKGPRIGFIVGNVVSPSTFWEWCPKKSVLDGCGKKNLKITNEI